MRVNGVTIERRNHWDYILLIFFTELNEGLTFHEQFSKIGIRIAGHKIWIVSYSMLWLDVIVRSNHYYIFSSHPVICERSRFNQMRIGGLQLSIRLEDERCHVGMLESINHVATLKTKLATSGSLTSRIIIMLYFLKNL